MSEYLNKFFFCFIIIQLNILCFPLERILLVTNLGNFQIDNSLINLPFFIINNANTNIKAKYFNNPDVYTYDYGPLIQTYIIELTFDNLVENSLIYANINFIRNPTFLNGDQGDYKKLYDNCQVYEFISFQRIWIKSKDNKIIQNPSLIINNFPFNNILLQISKSGTFGISCYHSLPFQNNQSNPIIFEYFLLIIFTIFL